MASREETERERERFVFQTTYNCMDEPTDNFQQACLPSHI